MAEITAIPPAELKTLVNDDSFITNNKLSLTSAISNIPANPSPLGASFSNHSISNDSVNESNAAPSGRGSPSLGLSLRRSSSSSRCSSTSTDSKASKRCNRCSQKLAESVPLAPDSCTLPPMCPAVAPPAGTFYKRALPSTCISFNSMEGKNLFRQAFEEGYLESYFSLSMQFLTQSEPAYCGLSTLCMILNALEIDPLRAWKGVWRWFDENMLDCCRPLDEIKQHGITLQEFQCMAECNSLNAETFRADLSTKEQFLEDLKRSCRSPDEYMVVSYCRGTLQQTGDGHFSPIGGYCEKEHKVLILDVARFKYPAYWVSADLLWEALKPHDSATGKPRGYVLLSRGTRSYVQSAFSQLSVNWGSWPRLSQILFQELPSRIRDLSSTATVQDFVALAVSSIPEEYHSVVEDRVNLFVPTLFSKDPQQVEMSLARQPGFETDEPLKEYLTGLDELLTEISKTDLYRAVAETMALQQKLNLIDKSLRALGIKTESESMFSPLERSIVTSPSELATDLNGSINHRSFSRDDRNRMSTPTLKRRGRAPSLRAFSRRESFSDVVPPNQTINDFAAFLTMFLFALFSYQPLYSHIQAKGNPHLFELAKKISTLMDPRESGVSKTALEEIELLRHQIEALHHNE